MRHRTALRRRRTRRRRCRRRRGTGRTRRACSGRSATTGPRAQTTRRRRALPQSSSGRERRERDVACRRSRTPRAARSRTQPTPRPTERSHRRVPRAAQREGSRTARLQTARCARSAGMTRNAPGTKLRRPPSTPYSRGRPGRASDGCHGRGRGSQHLITWAALTRRGRAVRTDLRVDETEPALELTRRCPVGCAWRRSGAR